MDHNQKKDLSRLIDEVFYQENRHYAELRLLPSDAVELMENYSTECVPMDGKACSDGKMWYQVWLLKM